MEILIVLAAAFVSVHFGAFDFLIPTLNKIAQKLGWQAPPKVDEKIGKGFASIVNSTAVVKSIFSNSAENMPFEGRVSVRGTEWKAEQISGDFPLSVGNKVIVRRIEGNKLYVETFSSSGV